MAQKLHKLSIVLVVTLSVLRKAIYGATVTQSLTKDGDVIFGVLLPLFRKDSNNECKVFNKDSLLWIKGINYALSELQSNKIPILRNISFGFHIRDTCTISALEQALNLIHSSKTHSIEKARTQKVISVISSHYEHDSSSLLSLFRIPNVIIQDFNGIQSAIGNTPVNKEFNFESLKASFYRAKAIVSLLKYFHWDSVFVIVNEVYQKEFLMFKGLAEQDGICIAGVSEGDTELLVTIKRSLNVRTLLAFTDIKSLLSALKEIHFKHPSHFTWIDTIGNTESITSDIMITGETVFSLHAEFKFINKLQRYSSPDCKKNIHSSNQLFSPDLCKIDREGSVTLDDLNQELNSKTSSSTLRKVAQERTKDLQGAINGVFTIGKAMISHMETNCWDKTKDECLDLTSCKDIAKELHTLTRNQFLESSSQQKPLLKENIFSLVSFQGNASTPQEIGTWEKAWFINRAAVRWPGKETGAPVSTCSPPCPAGFAQVAEEGRKCCWSCQPCNYNQYITENYTCVDCVRGYWPSSDYRTCEFKIHVTLMSCALAISSVSAVLYALVL